MDVGTAVAAVAVSHLSKSYGDRTVLGDVDLVVPAGRVHALIGPNGAGKTTLLRILLGLTRPDAGTVELLGGSLDDARARPSGGLAGFVDDPRFYPYLSARTNLRLLAALDGAAADAGDRVEQALTDAGLGERAGDRVGGFSLGMRQRLGLAAALLRRPGVLILDEPANGLDPAGSQELWQSLRLLAAGGAAVVLSSHDLAAVDEVADDVTVLGTGRVIWSGPLAVLRAHAPSPEHRLRTTDDSAAHEIAQAAGIADSHVVGGGPTAGGVNVHAGPDVLAAFTVSLGRSGIGVLELSPGTSPLRALFTALTSGSPLPVGLSVPAVLSPGAAAPANGPPANDPPVSDPRPPGTGYLFRAAVRTEARRLASQTRVRLLAVVCLLAPFAFAAVVRGSHTLPADTLYGRWLLESAAAEPLVVLAFAASWAFPLLGSVVAGDLLAAEDRLGTWPTLLTRSCGREVILTAKCLVAAACAVLAVVLLAVSAALAGLALDGRSPLVGLSGQLIAPGASERLVAIAWAGSLPTVLAWTAVALLLSALTRSAIVGIAGPAVLGVLGQLATLVDGPPVLRAFLLSSTLEAWHGLAEIPAAPRQLYTGVLVGGAWALLFAAVLAGVLGRRSAVDAVGAGRGRGGA